MKYSGRTYVIACNHCNTQLTILQLDNVKYMLQLLDDGFDQELISEAIHLISMLSLL